MHDAAKCKKELTLVFEFLWSYARGVHRDCFALLFYLEFILEKVLVFFFHELVLLTHL